MIDAQGCDIARRVEHIDLDAARLAHKRQHVGAGKLPPIDLAGAKRRTRRRGVGDDLPLDPVEIGELGACRAFGRA